MRRHVLFFSLALYGHVYPNLGLVAELVRRGHRVSYVTTGEFAETVKSVGADPIVYEPATSDPNTIPDTSDPGFTAQAPAYFVRAAIDQLPAAEQLFAEGVPDLIAYDVTSPYAALLLAHEWGLPTVKLFTTFASNDQYSLERELDGAVGPVEPGQDGSTEVEEKLAALRARFQVTDEEVQTVLLDDISVVYLPRSFQPSGETFDDRYAFVGPCVDQRPFQDGPDLPEDGRPLLAIGLGTMAHHEIGFLRDCVRAFEGSRWRVVIATGQLDPAELGELPDTIEACRAVGQFALLERAQAFIGHGGMGGTMEALFTGTPLAVRPTTGEQAFVANQLDQLGVGIKLPQGKIAPEELLAVADRLIEDEHITTAVRDMASDMRAAGGAPRAADHIEAYLRRRSR